MSAHVHVQMYVCSAATADDMPGEVQPRCSFPSSAAPLVQMFITGGVASYPTSVVRLWTSLHRARSSGYHHSEQVLHTSWQSPIPITLHSTPCCLEAPWGGVKHIHITYAFICTCSDLPAHTTNKLDNRLALHALVHMACGLECAGHCLCHVTVM